MKKNLLVILFLGFLLCGFSFSDSKPKCNDEDVLLTLKQILDNDKWIYVEYGLTDQSLRALQLNLNGMDLRDLEAVASADSSGVLKNTIKPILNFKDYANKAAKVSFEGFMTQNNDDDKKTFCKATLKLTYPQMPQDIRKNYANSPLKGAIFDGGDVEEQISYSAQYSDDKKHIYVEILE